MGLSTQIMLQQAFAEPGNPHLVPTGDAVVLKGAAPPLSQASPTVTANPGTATQPTRPFRRARGLVMCLRAAPDQMAK